MKPEENKSNRSDFIWKIAFVACLVLAVISLAVFGLQKLSQAQRERELAELAAKNTIPVESIVVQTEQEASSQAEPESEPEPRDILAELGVPIPEKAVDFAALQANTNPDIYAWIYIPDSVIDYPVLQHPTDNAYYLNYNLDGSKGYPGCIYTENYNQKDFSDPVTVFYGHNMKNGSMFAGLHKYEDSQYFAEHPYVYIYTPEKLLVYQVFASCVYSDKHILMNYDFSSSRAFDTFMEEVTGSKSAGNNYNGEIEVTPESHILVMSTCIAQKPNNRYLVLGVLLNED